MKTLRPNITTRRNPGDTISFVVDAGLINGKRYRRFFQTKGDAEKHARDLKSDHQRFGQLASSLSAEQRVDAARAFEKLRAQNLDKTLEFVVGDYIRRNAPKSGNLSCSELTRTFLSQKEKNGKKPKYLKTLRCELDRFNQTFATRAVSSITTPEIENWLDSLKGNSPSAPKPIAAITRINYIRDIKMLFTFAIKRGNCAENPLDPIERPALPTAPVEILSVEEAESLVHYEFAHSAPVWKKESLVPYIAIALFAGLRSSEIEALDWRNIDLQSRVIEVTAKASKTSNRRTVEISENLYLWLLPHRRASGPIVTAGWHERFAKACQSAGFNQWPRNAMRHSFASYHFAHHKDLARTMALTGHDESRTFHRHYKQLVKPQDAACYWNIFPPEPGHEWLRRPVSKLLGKKEIQLLTDQVRAACDTVEDEIESSHDDQKQSRRWTKPGSEPADSDFDSEPAEEFSSEAAA